MKNVMQVVGVGALALAFNLAGADAQASTWYLCGSTKVKWPLDAIVLRASSVGFPAGNPYRTALGTVETRWTHEPSKMTFTVRYDEASVGSGNLQNEIWWAAPPAIEAPAYADVWWNDDCEIIEADVVFNNTEAYTTSTAKASHWSYGGAYRPFHTTAMHEFGHAVGLGHTANRYSIMGTDWDHVHTNGVSAVAYPGEDAVAATVAVYGISSANVQDLGVSHWRWTGSSGEYSTHGRTRLFDSAGVELPLVAGTAEPVYRVNRGQFVRLEMTYENMSATSPRTVKVGYYLSANDFISTTDTFLAERTLTLYRSAPDTLSDTFLFLPPTLVSGQTYYLGAFIDYDGAVNEAYETNNASYLAIRVN